MSYKSLFEAVATLRGYGFDTPTNLEREMITITAVFKDGTFVPYGEQDYNQAHALKNGNLYRIKIENDRNGKLLAKYFELIDLVWDNLSERQQKCYSNNRTAFRHMVEFTAGCIEPAYDPIRNEMTMLRTSISYDSMSEKDFQEFFDRAKDVIVNVFLRKCNDKEYKDMILCF